ncbi:MAG: glycosyltransferase [Gemmobacter sp.]|nr:glycosyltransferase [Gemmobacter sp.]
MNRLLIVATAPVIEEGETLRLDVKFVDGMRAHCALWSGPVRCVLRRGATEVPFGASYRPEDLGFDLALMNAGDVIGAMQLDGAVAVFAAADDAQALGLVGVARTAGAKIVYSLEYTLETRLQIVRLDPARGFARRIWSMLWNMRQERRRVAALRAADGVQANGYPAYDAYRGLNPHTMMYLDGRMTPALMATRAEMAARRSHLVTGGPLRLIHSGRLEPMKGAQDLLPVMAALRAAGVAATLDIYGAGSMKDHLVEGAKAFGGTVTLHDPVDFVSRLVPISRRTADIFLSCHRQSDPSCSYIEAMGCGLTVVGYANRMWTRMQADAGVGAVAPLGNVAGLVAAIGALDHERVELAEACDRSLAFAKAHDFPTEFARRMDHLRALTLPEG